jgi:phosphatidate cytidylyltransferase
LKTRIISGAVLAVITISSLLVGSWYMYGLTLAIALIGMFELFRVIHMERSGLAYVGYIFCMLYYICISTGLEQYEMLVFAFLVIAVMSVYVFSFPKFTTEQVTMTVFGILYVAVMLSYIYRVRCMSDGIYLVWLIFVAAFGNDTCAYFVGVFFGKHKMSPKLSPKKSVEGAVGGVVGAAVIGMVYGLIVGKYLSVAYPVLTFGVASFIGAGLSIVGDLAASAIKRNHNVKDYGTLIPGHGGILDRFDSVIFTAPVVYWAVYIMNHIL